MGNNLQCLREPAVIITPDASHMYEMNFRTGQVLTNTADISFPLSTFGSKIVDGTGRRVKLACINWSGAHMCRHCVSGLEFRRLGDLCKEIRAYGFNGIRLTFSLQLYYQNPVVPAKYLQANPELVGLRAMEIFDRAVREMTQAGLMVILNNHTSSSMWCCSNDDQEGLWWTHEFPEYRWMDCLRHFAVRYRDNPRVIGFDLRNEIRKTPELTPSWGDGNILTDWRRAAVDAGNEILAISPHYLIMVGGLFYQLDLTDVRYAPIALQVPNKLVYTGHFYGFSWLVLSWHLWSYDRFKSKLASEQTYVRDLGVPFFLGEFGSNEQDIPWKYLMRFLKETDIDWSYWCLDGYKCDPDKDETYGLYGRDFREVRHYWKLNDLNSIQPSTQGAVPSGAQQPRDPMTSMSSQLALQTGKMY